MDKTIVSELTIGSSKPYMIGTASTGIKNYGDIDVNVDTDIKYKNELIDIIKNIENKYYLTEIKIMNKDKKIKSKKIDEISDSIGTDTDLIKIDFKVAGRKFDAYEVIFFLKDKKGIHIKEQLGALLMEGNYWKVLKRIFSIMRYENNKLVVDKITKFIETSVGKVGRFISLLESVEEIEKAFDTGDMFNEFKNKLNNKIKDIISKDKTYYTEKLINNNPKKWLNDKAREFIRKNNLL